MKTEITPSQTQIPQCPLGHKKPMMRIPGGLYECPVCRETMGAQCTPHRLMDNILAEQAALPALILAIKDCIRDLEMNAFSEGERLRLGTLKVALRQAGH